MKKKVYTIKSGYYSSMGDGDSIDSIWETYTGAKECLMEKVNGDNGLSPYIEVFPNSKYKPEDVYTNGDYWICIEPIMMNSEFMYEDLV